ncbi:putative GAF sensor protein [Calothrix sp. NIES-4071]|nr:putative GAF sensor protein [Calothrix sp. NIES-4071]BAZ60303.1 putative GAF sensor protein [Calothrix sp. NIES-4105]
MGQPQRLIGAEQHIISLGRVLQSLREEDNIDVLIQTIITFVKEQFDYNLAWVALYDRLNHILIGKGGFSPVPDNSYLNQRLVLSPGDLLEQVVIEQRPVGVADLRAEARASGWQELAKKHQIQGTIILPIRYKDRCLGVLLLGSVRWGYLLATDAKARLMMVLGELAAALHQYELDWQQKHTKRLEEPLLDLLQKLQASSNLMQRIEATVKAVHEFTAPTRTHIYWYEREGRYFWRRFSSYSNGNTQKFDKNEFEKNRTAVGSITVEDLSDFYYALATNEIVVIGEGRSSLKSHFTAQLMQRLQVRSLLAAPIIWQKDLLGFLAVEASEARIWKETDKSFAQGAAGLVSLVAPKEEMENTIEQIRGDANLTSEIAKGIYNERDFEQTLSNCAKKILERLGAMRFVLLYYNHDHSKYEILFQTQPSNRRPFNFHFDDLREVDWQLLERSSEAVAVENLEEDLRFFNWRSYLLEVGVRSLIVTNCQAGNAPCALILITHESKRAWTTRERELVQIVSQQVGVITRQWQLYFNDEQNTKIMQSFQKSLQILEQAQGATIESDSKNLEIISLRQIATVLNSPLGFMLSWAYGNQYAQIIPGLIAFEEFAINTEVSVPISGEALIQWALGSEGMMLVKAEDLPEDTRKWLHGSGIGQLLIVALRTNPDHKPTGVIVIGDRVARRWSQASLNAVSMLISQLAWSRRFQKVSLSLLQSKQDLQLLNWYKHRRFEENQRMSSSLINQIKALGVPNNEFTQVRYQQILRQLESTHSSLTVLLEEEQWQLQLGSGKMPVASLLKRALERIDKSVKEKKLWVGVHGLGQNIVDSTSKDVTCKDVTGKDVTGKDVTGKDVTGKDVTGKDVMNHVSTNLSQYSLTVIGDIVKIELIMNEILTAAVERSVTGGRIDFWCRRLEDNSLELSITDNGSINAQLLAELYQDASTDVLVSSYIDQPPGLHLLICQNMVKQMGGELNFYQLPDGRIVSRLLLALATK